MKCTDEEDCRMKNTIIICTFIELFLLGSEPLTLKQCVHDVGWRHVVYSSHNVSVFTYWQNNRTRITVLFSVQYTIFSEFTITFSGVFMTDWTMFPLGPGPELYRRVSAPIFLLRGYPKTHLQQFWVSKLSRDVPGAGTTRFKRDIWKWTEGKREG